MARRRAQTGPTGFQVYVVCQQVRGHKYQAISTYIDIHYGDTIRTLRQRARAWMTQHIAQSNALWVMGLQPSDFRCYIQPSLG
jgi:hypothetical protein